MSGSITSPDPSSSAATAGSGTTTGSPTNALASLGSNFSSFLQLLMAQLQHQDPTSPMDTNQFTSELVQFSSVEQQINTNSSLGKLIQLTQGGEVVQSTAMLGRKVTATSDHLSLQNGSAGLQFTSASAGRVGVVVTDDAGHQLYATTLNATTGSNSWTWNGQNSAGNQVADGAYRVAVTQDNADGSSSALPFTITGTATGVQDQGSSVQLDLGALPVDFANIRSVAS